MTDQSGGPWDALRRAYAPAQRGNDGSGLGILGKLQDVAEAPPCEALADDLETRLDMARERAAIMEIDGGLPRDRAEALACKRYGLASLG